MLPEPAAAVAPGWPAALAGNKLDPAAVAFVTAVVPAAVALVSAVEPTEVTPVEVVAAVGAAEFACVVSGARPELAAGVALGAAVVFAVVSGVRFATAVVVVPGVAAALPFAVLAVAPFAAGAAAFVVPFAEAVAGVAAVLVAGVFGTGFTAVLAEPRPVQRGSTPPPWRILAVTHLTSYNEVFVTARLCGPMQARNSRHSRQETANHPWKQHKYSTAL